MNVVLIADAEPLITLAYADSLDVLFKPGWSVQLVDMAVHEVTRNQTPTSSKIQEWITEHSIQVRQSTTYQRYLLRCTQCERETTQGKLRRVGY